jgi:hypothetical protein
MFEQMFDDVKSRRSGCWLADTRASYDTVAAD